MLLHETGHSIFGLADEYAPDGGYWQDPHHPNVFTTEEECIAHTGFSSCRSWNPAKKDANGVVLKDGDGDTVIDYDHAWWTSDPEEDDLMVDEGPPRALDIERMRWKFYECLARRCGRDTSVQPPDITAPAPTPDLATDVLPSQGMNAGEASIVSEVRFDTATKLEVKTTKVVKGAPPAMAGNAPMIRMRALSESGSQLTEAFAWNPYLVSVEDGSGGHHVEPNPGGTDRFVLPFDPAMSALELRDALAGDTSLVTIDVRPAVAEFCGVNPSWVGCREVDLAVAGLSVGAVPTRLEVGETATVVSGVTAANQGAASPVDAVVTSTGATSAGGSVSPATMNTPVPALASGATGSVTTSYTIGCSTAGSHTYTLGASIDPAHAADVNAHVENDAVSTSFQVLCNRAPVVDATRAYALTSVTVTDTENSGTSVSQVLASGGPGGVTDPDGEPVGLAVTATSSGNGTWQWSSGGMWANVGPVSESSALLLAPDARIRLVPTLAGSVTGVTFRAWDRTSGTAGAKVDVTANGGASAFSTKAATAGIIVAKATQSIVFTSMAPSNAVVGGGYVPAATGGGSGNPVTFTVNSSAGICAMSGTKVVFQAVGSCVVVANQAGNANYFAAPRVTQSITIAKAPTTLVATPVGVLFVTLKGTLTRDIDNAPLAGRTVVFSVGGRPICTRTTGTDGVATCSVLAIGLGSTYTASWSGDADHLPSQGSARFGL